MSESFLNGKVVLYRGDCLERLREIEQNSVDACVCDPPYHLTTNKKGGSGIASGNLDSPYGRSRIGTGNGEGGFMGKKWDSGDIAQRPLVWELVLRVLKPGAHLIAFGGTRTYHRMACAIEDAGFEIRDQIGWCYGSGFPKSHDISKAIDRMAGAEREVIAEGKPVKRMIPGADQHKQGWEKNNGREFVPNETSPATDAAREWQGWGTALKPAWEPIVLARKPLSESSIAANVLRWGTGAINVDGCRVEAVSRPAREGDYKKTADNVYEGRQDGSLMGGSKAVGTTDQGRWPANLIHDGSEEALERFPNVRDSHSPANAGSIRKNQIYGNYAAPRSYHAGFPDCGSASRFFYTAKADADDRLGSKHPTVKPLDLMQYLVRLVTPKGGLVLDPFAGTGTTGEAACREGMRAILIEQEEEYQADITRRMTLCLAGPDERAREAIKAAGKVTADAGPLFGGGMNP